MHSDARDHVVQPSSASIVRAVTLLKWMQCRNWGAYRFSSCQPGMRLIGRGDSFARDRRGNLQDGRRRNTRETRHWLDAACVRASRSLSRRCWRWRAHRICVCHGFALGELRCVGNGCTVWNSFVNSQQPTGRLRRGHGDASCQDNE